METHAKSTPPAPLLSVEEARRVLGISQSALYRLLEHGELRSVRIGARRLFEPDELAAFVAARREGEDA